jgi:acetoacetyl-CoA reductase
MGDMTGQVALVTGGIRGIGRAISERLAARGITIAAGYSRGQEAADKFCADHPGATVHQGNIGSAEDCERVIREVLETHGKLDILVNNAGITLDRTVRKMTVEDWDRVVQVNLSGAFYLSRAILQHMLDRASGRIINISSIIGEAGNIGQANYAASKSGLIGLTMSLAQETALQGHHRELGGAGLRLHRDGPGRPAGSPRQGRRQDPGRPPRRARRDRPGRGVPRRSGLRLHHRPALLGQRRPVHVMRAARPTDRKGG